MTPDTHVWVFFYGSYMNFSVLKEVDLVPDRWEVAKLHGFDIRISPRANLVKSDKACVYGIVAATTHPELERLYGHAKDVLGQVYLPQAVLTESLEGKHLPALCYIAPNMKPAPPDRAYVNRIVGPAKALGFPEWYVERLESFGETLQA